MRLNPFEVRADIVTKLEAARQDSPKVLIPLKSGQILLRADRAAGQPRHGLNPFEVRADIVTATAK